MTPKEFSIVAAEFAGLLRSADLDRFDPLAADQLEIADKSHLLAELTVRAGLLRQALENLSRSSPAVSRMFSR